MLEIFVFFVTLAIIRGYRRRAPATQPPLRVDVYHHGLGGPGETWPQEPPLLLTERVGNVVPLRRSAR